MSPSFLRRGWPRRITLIGYFLPVVVGLCVRVYLQRMARPVVEWSWFFEPVRLMGMAISLAYWDIPFLLIAAMAGRRPLKDRKNRILVTGGFLGTLLLSILVFADLWRNIEAIMMGTILIPFFILPGTLVGLGIGWLIARFSSE
jgi:hypothetical protein